MSPNNPASDPEFCVRCNPGAGYACPDHGPSSPVAVPAEPPRPPLGVSVIVTLNRPLFKHTEGTTALVIGQARNGPNRYSVMVPGDPMTYSVKAADMTVVRAIDEQSWWRSAHAKPPAGTPVVPEAATALDLEPIKNRAEAATSGPWYWSKYGMRTDCQTAGITWILDERGEELEPPDRDADFIANAREDIPALVAEIERLRSESSRA